MHSGMKGRDMTASVEHPAPPADTNNAHPIELRETTPEERRRVKLASTIGTTIEF